MELLLKVIFLAHIFAGGITLISGPIAIFYNFKQPRNHKLAGKIFFYAMFFVCASAVIGFLKQPDQIFYQFLLGIAVLVWAGIMRGIRSVMLMKGGKITNFDWVYTSILGFAGLAMVGWAGWLLSMNVNIAFPILFTVFGAGALKDTVKNYRIFSNWENMSKFQWMELHLVSMLGAFIASTTAFTVNAAPFLPWPAQWFGPTVMLVPVVYFFVKKVKSLSGNIEKTAPSTI